MSYTSSGLPYPADTDPLSTYPALLKSLAESVSGDVCVVEDSATRAYGASQQDLFSVGGASVVTDPKAMWNAATKAMLIKTAGLYAVGAMATFDTAAANVRRFVQIALGTEATGGSRVLTREDVTSLSYATHQVVGLYPLLDGMTVHAHIYQGAAANIRGDLVPTRFWAVRLPFVTR